ncbi:reverse transcriptase domain-containing protein [Tanacetum coccineum]
MVCQISLSVSFGFEKYNFLITWSMQREFRSFIARVKIEAIKKWVKITMDLVTKLLRTLRGHDSIWVIIDWLRKSVHFLLNREDFKLDNFAKLHIKKIAQLKAVVLTTVSTAGAICKGAKHKCRHQIKEAVKSGQLSYLVKGIKKGKAKVSNTQLGYHQIQMAKEDEDKTAFFAGKGVFCYRKMPFGLKNAGATYQSTSEEDMIKDIQETFDRFRSVNMKLNPKNALLVSKRTLKDVHSLNGKLAALSRFLSKGAKKSLLSSRHSRVLRSVGSVSCSHNGKHKRYFTRKKRRRTSPHLLRKWGTARSKAQLPRNGKTHIGTCVRCKKALNIFPSTPIRVLTDAPIKQTLIPKDFYIEMPYDGDERITASGIVTKKENSELDNTWKLYTDGASSSDGLGAGLMLSSPGSKEYTYALRFEFETTNNKTEYEALLAEVLVEVLAKRSINKNEVSKIEAEKGESWLTPTYEYLISGLLPEDPKEARKIRSPTTITSKDDKQFREEAIIPTTASLISKKEEPVAGEKVKRKEGIEVASIEEAYYWNQL